MNKITALLVLLLVTQMCLTAQSQKIKGSRNVTLKQNDISDFKTIIVDSDFEIELVYNSKSSVEIEADDNLHEIITFEVVDSVLTFSKSARITSSKKLNIKVNFREALNTIEANADGEISSISTLELEDLTLKTTDNAKVNLNIRAKNFTYKSSGKSKSNLNISADSSYIELNDNSKLEGIINSKKAEFDMYQRSTAKLEGSVNNLVVRLDNSTSLKGDKLRVSDINAILEGNSDLYIDVTNSISINSSGDSEIYLYGTPKITIEKFEGTPKLQKKNRN